MATAKSCGAPPCVSASASTRCPSLLVASIAAGATWSTSIRGVATNAIRRRVASCTAQLGRSNSDTNPCAASNSLKVWRNSRPAKASGTGVTTSVPIGSASSRRNPSIRAAERSEVGSIGRIIRQLPATSPNSCTSTNRRPVAGSSTTPDSLNVRRDRRGRRRHGETGREYVRKPVTAFIGIGLTSAYGPSCLSFVAS